MLKKCIDFKEIFSPVVKMSSTRVVMRLAASLNLEIEQLDVKKTFLHNNLEEKICMVQPKRFNVKGKEELMNKLKTLIWAEIGTKVVVKKCLILSWRTMVSIRLCVTIMFSQRSLVIIISLFFALYG